MLTFVKENHLEGAPGPGTTVTPKGINLASRNKHNPKQVVATKLFLSEHPVVLRSARTGVGIKSIEERPSEETDRHAHDAA
jgi:hypothetical protein